MNENIFVKNWERINENYFQINYILPNEDVDDYITIKNNLNIIEKFNFKKILKKYKFENYIIQIVFREKKISNFIQK